MHALQDTKVQALEQKKCTQAVKLILSSTTSYLMASIQIDRPRFTHSFFMKLVLSIYYEDFTQAVTVAMNYRKVRSLRGASLIRRNR